MIAVNSSKAQNSLELESLKQVEFTDSYVLLEKQNKKGLATQSGQRILLPVYDEISISNPYIFLRKFDKKGLAALDGQILVPVE